MCNRLGIAAAVMLALAAPCFAAPPRDDLAGSRTYGFDLIVGPRSSPWQLAINTIYHLRNSPGNIPYSLYDDLAGHKYEPDVRIAVPVAFGDWIDGKYCIEATLPKLFGIDDDTGQPLLPDRVLEYRPGERYHLAHGKCFATNRFEAVVGSDLPGLTGLKIGSDFRATHGKPRVGEKADVHPETWKVVGILAPTHTPADRTAFIPLQSFYAIDMHAIGLLAQKAIRNRQPIPALPDGFKAYATNADGTFTLNLPRDAWAISAVLVRSRGGISVPELTYNIAHGSEGAMAVTPESAALEPAEMLRPFLILGVIPDGSASDGVTVAATTTGSPAARAGITPGDVVIRLDDHPINTNLDLAADLANSEPSQTVHIKIQRAGHALMIDVPLAMPAH